MSVQGAPDEAPSDPYTASVIGGSGYAGGELLRLLVGHPNVDVVQATSASATRRSVGHVHPNLRGVDLRFTPPDELEPVDVLFAATPHGVSMERIEAYLDAADLVVDLSADFRLPTAEWYDDWYDGHAAPTFLEASTYGLVELTRGSLPGSSLVAVGGCNATVSLLALAPLVEAGLLSSADRVVLDVKVGSSEGGRSSGPASSHAERSGVVRPYAPTGHRHEAEIEAYLDLSVSFTAHAIELVRGAAVTAHVFPSEPVDRGELWSIYRDRYDAEPFVRLVSGSGLYRYPEPKAVAGTNVCEVGLEVDEDRVVVFAAIDNLGKGSAGQAIHATNVALGLPETAGLTFAGLHPVGVP
ncbi:MAG: N-acetyl-gamma-glutamyl-phosphate reductase [Halobacteriota archaeon]